MATSSARGRKALSQASPPELSHLFGQEIRRRRQMSKFSQEDLADRAHLDRTTIGRIERGELRATLEVADAIARAFGSSLWNVLREAEERQLISRQNTCDCSTGAE